MSENTSVLCHDIDRRLQIRKDGYRAITYVSKEQRKWVKRNADVLVQLLQSGKSPSGQ